MRHSMKAALLMAALLSLFLFFAALKVERLEQASDAALLNVAKTPQAPLYISDCQFLKELSDWSILFPDDVRLIRNWGWLQVLLDRSSPCKLPVDQILSQLQGKEVFFYSAGLGSELSLLYYRLGAKVASVASMNVHLRGGGAPAQTELQYLKLLMAEGVTLQKVLPEDPASLLYWSTFFQNEWSDSGRIYRDDLSVYQQQSVDALASASVTYISRAAPLLREIEPYLLSSGARKQLVEILPEVSRPYPVGWTSVSPVIGFTSIDSAPERSSLSYWNNRQTIVLDAPFGSSGFYASTTGCHIVTAGLEKAVEELPPIDIYSSPDNAFWRKVDAECSLETDGKSFKCGPFEKIGAFVKLHHPSPRSRDIYLRSYAHYRIFRVPESECTEL